MTFAGLLGKTLAIAVIITIIGIVLSILIDVITLSFANAVIKLLILFTIGLFITIFAGAYNLTKGH
jgi:hypothetical protein|nr:MAG TPA: hypothetical protein [Caudoviricetes sp.]